MTREEAVNWLINIMADIGKIEHQDLWHYEQALSEIRELLEAQPEVIACGRGELIVNATGDPISRQAAIDEMKALYEWHDTVTEDRTIDHLKRLPSAQLEPQWIPCKKQMPEPDSWAIWCSKNGLIQVARWKEDAINHFWPDQGFFELEDAVAWMPLPIPYRPPKN